MRYVAAVCVTLACLLTACEQGPAAPAAPYIRPEAEDVIARVEKGDAARDAEAAFIAGDYRFLDVTGFGAIGGVEGWDRSFEGLYGTVVIGGSFGMVISQEDRQQRQRLRAYAEKYNRALWAKLVKAGKARPHQGPRLPDDPQALVELLAITGEAAVMAPIFTPDRDTPETDRRIVAYAAAEKLREMGTKAFPVLLGDFGDERQSVAFRSSTSQTLGFACFCIIDDVVDPDPPGYHHYRPGQVAFLMFDKDLMALWWKERAGRDVKALRIEAAQYNAAAARAEKLDDEYPVWAGVLKELGAKEWGPEHPTIKALAAALAAAGALPGNPKALVGLLGVSGATYIECRLSAARADKAWGRLHEMGTAAFPALVEGAEDPAVGGECLRLLRWQVETDLAADCERFCFLTKPTLRQWWKERAGWTLRKMQIDAARHSLKAIEAATFQNEEEKSRWVNHLQAWIADVQRKDGAEPDKPAAP
jgi:hypothetical protein